MSFFGSSAKKDEKEVVTIAKTGGFIDGLIQTLIQSVNDKKDSVKEAVQKGIKDIGDQHPELVMSACVNFLQTDTKASNAHRVLILKSMKAITDDNRDRISRPLALAAINLAFAEMTESKEIKPEWQNTASELLVSLGILHGQAVLDWVLKRLTPGEIPHYFVVKTLGDLAVADPVHVVPNLKEIFGRLVSLLNLIKHDNVRWVFTFAIGRFCEGVIYFLANSDAQQIEQAGITKTSFSGEVFTAYQIMFDNWLQRNEPSLRLVIMQAVGYMAETMARDQFEAQLPKMITGILQMYRKDKKFLPITQGLGLVLNVAVADESRVLDPLLQIVLQTVHAVVVAGPEYSATDSSVMKNYSELLRCFEIICKVFSENVVSFLLQRFESKEERVRIATLNILKHLVNSSHATLEDKRELLVSGLRPVLSETNLKVRKAFAQVVITLASHDYLGLEGGQLLVEFVIRQCSVTKDEEERFNKAGKKEPDGVSPTALKSMCDNVLNLLTTTIPAMENVLWPYLLELIVPLQYTDAISVVTKSLAYIANKKRSSEDAEYMIDFDKLVNLPKPQAIISRLLVVVSRPQERPQVGENILAFFKAMGPVLHPSVSELWDDVVPKLANYLKDKSEDPAHWVQTKWEDLILKLLLKTIEEVNDDEWNIQLGEEMCKQFPLYNNNSFQKSMLFKCLGVVLQKSTKKLFVREKLDYMFSMVDHTIVEDREGCAVGYGFCASVHLDTVLDKLQGVISNDMKKKSTGFLGLMSDKSDKDIDSIKCTVMLCYGFSAAKADVTLIKSRIEVHILNNIIPYISNAKSALIKECIIRCVDLLGKTMHPTHLQSEYICTKRKDLLSAMVRFVTTNVKGEVSPEVLTSSVNASATLVQLEPKLPLDEEAELISKILGVIVRLPVAEASIAETMSEGFELIVQAILEKECPSSLLDRLLKYGTPYLADVDPVKRRRILHVLDAILKHFIEAANALEKKERNSDNVDLVKWIAMIIPRCTDSHEDIRTLAVGCIDRLLVVKGMLASVSETLAQKIAVILERITVVDTNAQFGVVHDLSRSLAPELTSNELFPFVQVLLEGLSDKEVTSASGTCIVLNGILRLRGGELAAQVGDIVTGLHQAMKGISNEQTLNGALHSLRTLTGHHLVLVAEQFLLMPLPHDEHAIKALKTLAGDAKLGPLLTKHYMDLLANSQPYVEKPKNNSKKDYTKEATKSTLAVTCTLGEMFEVEQMEETVRAVLPTMLGAVLLRVGATNGIEKANADGRDCNADAVHTFKQFLKCIKDEDVLACLDKDNTAELSKPDFHLVFIKFSGLIFEGYNEHIRDLVVFLTPYLNTNFDTQRITVAAIFAEFIRHCKEQSDLLALLINPLIFRLSDPVPIVKLLVIEGLGNVSEAGEEEVNRYSTTILSALMSGMEDATSSPEMTEAAMNGLSKIMAIVDSKNVVSILVNICLKLKNYFETPNDNIRASAITLFGALSRFGEGPCKSMFYDQIQTNLVSLLLHLNDTNAEVKKATKITLKKLGPLLQADEINDLLQTLSEDKALLYGEFMHALSKRMIHYYGKQVNMYLMDSVNFFKSNWTQNRANAAMFIGFLLGQLPKETRKSVNVDHVCSALTLLIKDDDEFVRQKSVEAIALLYDY